MRSPAHTYAAGSGEGVGQRLGPGGGGARLVPHWPSLCPRGRGGVLLRYPPPLPRVKGPSGGALKHLDFSLFMVPPFWRCPLVEPVQPQGA